jgi:hypothetical protein
MGDGGQEVVFSADILGEDTLWTAPMGEGRRCCLVAAYKSRLVVRETVFEMTVYNVFSTCRTHTDAASRPRLCPRRHRDICDGIADAGVCVSGRLAFHAHLWS